MKIGRNDPCHCGSGQKYKKCCAAKDEATRLASTAARAAEAAEAAEAIAATPQDSGDEAAAATSGAGDLRPNPAPKKPPKAKGPPPPRPSTIRRRSAV